MQAILIYCNLICHTMTCFDPLRRETCDAASYHAVVSHCTCLPCSSRVCQTTCRDGGRLGSRRLRDRHRGAHPGGLAFFFDALNGGRGAFRDPEPLKSRTRSSATPESPRRSPQSSASRSPPATKVELDLRRETSGGQGQRLPPVEAERGRPHGQDPPCFCRPFDGFALFCCAVPCRAMPCHAVPCRTRHAHINLQISIFRCATSYE